MKTTGRITRVTGTILEIICDAAGNVIDTVLELVVAPSTVRSYIAWRESRECTLDVVAEIATRYGIAMINTGTIEAIAY